MSEEQIADLNVRLQNKIKKDQYGDSQRVFIQYSDHEHTYEEHIKDMLEDLSYAGISISAEIKNYTNHSDVRLYYPDYLKRCLKEIINEK